MASGFRPSPIVIQLEIGGLLTEDEKGSLRARLIDQREWVLVKGWHDSGTIDGVYGPYTEAHIDWLMQGLLEYSSGNWTKIKLSGGPEPETASQRLHRLAEPGE